MYNSEDDDDLDRLSTESPVKNEIPYKPQQQKLNATGKKREEEAEPSFKLGLAFFKQKQERKLGGAGQNSLQISSTSSANRAYTPSNNQQRRENRYDDRQSDCSSRSS